MSGWDKPGAASDRPHENGEGLPRPPRNTYNWTDAERRDFAERYQRAAGARDNQQAAPPTAEEVRERRRADDDQIRATVKDPEKAERYIASLEKFRASADSGDPPPMPPDQLRASVRGIQDAAKAPEGKAEGTDRAESTDVPEATDKLAEITEKADKQAERIEKLQQQIEHRDDRIEALEERLERKDDLIGYLQGELAKERGDKPREAREAEDDADVLDSKEVPDRAAEDEPEKRGRHIKMPSTEAVSVGAGLLGGGEAIGAVTHTLTTGEQGLIGAGATLGVAAFAWGKKLWKDHHSDRPED